VSINLAMVVTQVLSVHRVEL